MMKHSTKSNVVFIVQGERLLANRDIMSERSDYFRALLCGGFSESKQSEIVLNAPLQPFRQVLDYIQNSHLPPFELENAIGLVELANEYSMSDLLADLENRLFSHLDYNNLYFLLSISRLYNLRELSKYIFRLLDVKASSFVKKNAFKQLPLEFLVELLKRDSFSVSESEIFKAVLEWRAANPNENFQAVIAHVRFVLMDFDELLDVVGPLGIFNAEELLNIIKDKHLKTASKNLPHRHLRVKDVNLATSELSARCIKGVNPHLLLDGNTKCYNFEPGSGWTGSRVHPNNQPENGIIVELGSIYIINHIRMLLWDKDSRIHSYYIAVSCDGKSWERIVDFSGPCNRRRSWQTLDFDECPARFISIVGTHNSVNEWFCLVHFEAKYEYKLM